MFKNLAKFKIDDDIRLLSELEINKEYTVIITTGGGLYRYNMNDKIKVINMYNNLPVIEFVGKQFVSDLVGEKLGMIHVEKVVNLVLGKLKIKYKFLLFAPEREKNYYYYVLFIELTQFLSNSIIKKLISDIQIGLKNNFHYNYAIQLGQLKNLKIFQIFETGKEQHIERCIQNGQKIGDIKNNILNSELN